MSKFKGICFGVLVTCAAAGTASAQVPTYEKLISRLDKCQIDLLKQDLQITPGQLLDTKGPDGKPMLLRASETDCDEGIENLILNGADVNIVDATGRTALHVAAEKSTEKVCKLLINRGAKVDVATKTGETVLQAAERNNYKGKTEQREKIIKLLKSKGAK